MIAPDPTPAAKAHACVASGLIVSSARPMPFPCAPKTARPDLWVHEVEYDALAPPQGADCVHRLEDLRVARIFQVFQRGREYWLEDHVWRVNFRAKSGSCRFAKRPGSAAQPAFELLAERVMIPLYRLFSEERFLALHGSAVCLDGRAWLFVGPSGVGKSTTTLEFLRRGASLLSDDLILVDVPAWSALPSAPVVRIIGGAEDVVEAQADKEIAPGVAKRWFRLPDRYCGRDPVPVAGVVALRPVSGAALPRGLARIEGQRAFACAMAQCFDLSDPGSAWRRRRFACMAEWVRSVPIFEYSFQRSDTGLPTHVEPLWASLRSSAC